MLEKPQQKATKALELRPDVGAVHKWYAITLSEIGQFKPTSETIK